MPRAFSSPRVLSLTEWLAPLAKPLVMGIVNVTPDSFHDGGRHFSPEKAAEHALRLEAEGADILDIGAESTRPGSAGVTTEDELKRLLPVLDRLKGKVRVPISIDTQKAEVARNALERGALMLNDVSAFRTDPGLATLAVRMGCPVILMHMQGTPRTMQAAPYYEDALRDIRDFLAERIAFFEKCGGSASQLLVDPGLGFGKTTAHNVELLRSVGGLKELGRPVVIGASRKSFLGRILGSQGDDVPAGKLPPPEERYEASLAAALFAAQGGADLLRVHDVQGTVRALKVWRALSRGADE